MSRRDSEAGAHSSQALASSGLLSFYDRLRHRLSSAIEAGFGRDGHAVAQVLLLAPDLFILLARLALDRRVPQSTRRLIVGALVYFVAPADLLPELMLGPAGFVDDVMLATLVLSRALDPELQVLVESHWNGSQRLREVLRDASQAALHLLGPSLYQRLRALAARRGLRL